MQNPAGSVDIATAKRVKKSKDFRFTARKQQALAVFLDRHKFTMIGDKPLTPENLTWGQLADLQSNLIQAVHEERGPHEIPDATLTTPAHAKQLARACWTDARAAKLRSAEQSALRSAATN
eukprot:m.421213 g.421213  ORF g.421213 m.421213 type:complete len:121 (-) comp20194_c0_seq13:404-766(-)